MCMHPRCDDIHGRCFPEDDHDCDGPARCEDESHLPEYADCTSTDPTDHQGDTCPIHEADGLMDNTGTREEWESRNPPCSSDIPHHEREWITAWSYWDYNGQEYVEWTDREILLNVGKLVRCEADAAPDVRSFHLARLERMLSDYWGMKVMVQKELKDRYTALPEWVARENQQASGWEKGT